MFNTGHYSAIGSLSSHLNFVAEAGFEPLKRVLIASRLWAWRDVLTSLLRKYNVKYKYLDKQIK